MKGNLNLSIAYILSMYDNWNKKPDPKYKSDSIFSKFFFCEKS